MLCKFVLKIISLFIIKIYLFIEISQKIIY